ncbi:MULTISPECIES: glycosyltransferase [unclassified Halomonas]|uniref:glycosyltransferase n=1 Tax=unclassified Halomonas TaxID=2609666 RepID=UPI0013F4FB32|nr:MULTISPECIES: glycosyltransferase [unclassified Halomonas]MBT2786014.1 glycosyltransferase [Halomonas sp. ISL-106]MBT2797036.1 glycosyltransferase [Halomonas sp. ISL-104]
MTVREMLLQLAARGYEIKVLGATIFDNPKGMGRLKEQYSDLNAHLHQLIEAEDGPLNHQLVVSYSHNRSHFTSHEEGLWYSQYLYMLDSFKPDVVWYYGGQTLDMLIAAEARDRGIPVAFYLANGNYKASNWCRDIDLILTDSQATADMYRKTVGYAAKPVGKFIAPENFIAEHHERNRLLFVNPSWQKGASVVVQLAEKLERERPDIELEVVEARADWPAVLRETTRRMGEQRNSLSNVVVTPNTSDMRGPYSRARVVVAPSLWWESSGRMLAEAMLNGIPALITNRGGMPEMIGDAGIAFDFPDACYEEPYQHLLSDEELQPLTDAVISFFDDEDLYQDYVDRARQVGKEKHHLDRATDKLISALTPLVGLRAGNKDFAIIQKKRHRQRLASRATKPTFKVDNSFQQLVGAGTNAKPGEDSQSQHLCLANDFTWQFKGKVMVLDNRASLIKSGLAEQMVATKAFGIVAFDPASEVKDAKQYDGSEYIQLFQHALLGDGKAATLHACVAPEMSSTLSPLPAEKLPKRHQLGAKPLAELPISSIAIDSIEGLGNLDWLILDELSDAMAVLENGKKALTHTLLIQVRVPFQLTHEKQPSFAELQHWASRNGFRFYRFHNIRHYSHLPEELNSRAPCATEQESADVLFLPSHERMAALSDENKTKLAFVLSAVFAVHDVAFELLADISKNKALEFLEAQELLPKASATKTQVPPPAGPPIPQSEHVKGEAVVTVLCPTYNHGPYIEDALKGFVSQKTNFPFEVIVIDDASTDDAQEIISRYASEYPELIRPVFNEVNLRSSRKGMAVDLKKMARGKYIAYCEGDDYWVDENQLQLQFDFMESNSDYSVCYHNAFVFSGNDIVRRSKLPDIEKRDFSQDDLLLNNCFLLTQTRFIRKEDHFSPRGPEARRISNGDNLLISRLGLLGKGKYLANIKPAAYRLHEQSTWSSKKSLDKMLMLSNSLNWIGVFHEREGRKKVAAYYYGKSKATANGSYFENRNVSKSFLIKLNKLGVEKPCDILEFSSLNNLFFKGSNNVVKSANSDKNTFIVDVDGIEFDAPDRHYKMTVISEFSGFSDNPEKLAREVVRISSSVVVTGPEVKDEAVCEKIKKIFARHAKKTDLLDSGSMVFYAFEKGAYV